MSVIQTSGKRKQAIARATLRKGTGKVRVNNRPLDLVTPRMSQMKMYEPLILVGDKAKEVDIDVSVHGGGVASQAEASRLAIARALVNYDESNEDIFAEYDRRLLVADVRRKESAKPNSQGSARSKRQKSYR